MEIRSKQADGSLRADRVGITAVIATYNEERYIGRCLSALLGQEGVGDDVEILVVDGGSSDRTVEIVRSFPEFGEKIRLLYNPRKLQVYAWNLALAQMRGAYYAMIIAHADYAPDYLATCRKTLERTKAAAVGGVFRACGDGPLGEAIAFCMSSPFGVGGARFRYLQGEEQCDTVAQLFARRETIEAAGGWDERIPFDEDSDLSYRLRSRGGTLIVSSSIVMRYYARRSLHALAGQMFRYGYWRRFTQCKHPRNVPLRVMAPPALVAGMAASAVLGLTAERGLALVVPVLYGAFLVSAACIALRRIGLRAAFVPAALAVMHFSYGAGYLAALSRVHSPLHDIPDRIPAR